MLFANFFLIMTYKTPLLVYGVLFYTLQRVCLLAWLFFKLSLRSVNFWLFKPNLINKNLRCGNRTEVNLVQNMVRISKSLNAWR